MAKRKAVAAASTTRPVRPRNPGARLPLVELENIYQVGQRLRDAQSTRESTVNVLKGDFDLDLDKAYKARALVERYSPKEFRELCALNRGKEWLSWSHVRILLSIPVEKKKLRDTLQKRAADERWSYRKLAVEVQAALGGKKRNRGRPSKKWVERSPSVGLQQLVINTDAWLRYFVDACEDPNFQSGVSREVGLLAKLENLPTRKFSAAFKDQLEKAVERLTELKKEVSSALRVIDTVHQRAVNGSASAS